MRGSAVCLLLLQATIVVSSNAQIRLGKNKEKVTEQAPDAVDTKAGDVTTSAEAEAREPGADLVNAALLELRKIPPTVYRRKQQSSGLFGTIFRYLFTTIPTKPAAAPSESQAATLSGPLLAAVELLEEAAQQDNADALYILGDFNFYGNYSHPRDLFAAFNWYQQLAASHGNTTAQYMLGLYYSTGLGDVVPRDQAKSLLYYTFAAIRGNTRAEMATGFRHHSGIGASKSCDTAIKYYKRVADKAINWYRAGPPGGRTWVHQGWRIADEDGGIYGQGASVSSAGMNAFRAGPHSDAHAAIGDVIEYLDLMSQKGDSKASFNLGRIFYDGQRGLEQNFDLARKYFVMVTTRYWKRDGRVNENHKQGTEKIAGKAAGFMGRMYMRGDGVSQDFERARLWFKRGISEGDAQSRYGMGLILLNGYDGKPNIKMAMEYFASAAEQDYAPAQVQMGQLYLDQGGVEDIRIASNHFELAARHGNIEAFYYLAEMVFHGVGREKMCNTALSYYKSVAERAEPLVSPWADANDAYEAGEYESAFLQYLMAAEQGYERAQTNVAYMLDTERSKMSITQWLYSNRDRQGLLANPGLALIHWTRSSRQSNIDSLVKVGDYYFYGIGAEPDVSKAVQCYQGAADYSQSAQALFNLGWMHENGVGLTQDFHLAKRYYDHALEVNEEAYLPVTLSLLKLRMRSAWNTLTHGPIHSIQDEPRKSKDWSLSEWINNFLQDDGYYEEGYYDDSLYDETMRRDEDDLDDGGVLESILIIGITMSLVLLLWWRQRMQQGHEQANDGQRQNQQGQPPHDPQANRQNPAGEAFRGWAGGGLGL